MKAETKMRTVLTADDGMILTDGKSYGRKVYLAEGADVSVYREITEDEYRRIMAEAGDEVL